MKIINKLKGKFLISCTLDRAETHRRRERETDRQRQRQIYEIGGLGVERSRVRIGRCDQLSDSDETWQKAGILSKTKGFKVSTF